MSTNYWTDTANWRTTASTAAPFRKGAPGKYTSVLLYTGLQLDLTGSNYGYGAIHVVKSTGATASLAEGGEIPCGRIPTLGIQDISVSKLSGAADGGAEIYVFKRQQ